MERLELILRLAAAVGVLGFIYRLFKNPQEALAFPEEIWRRWPEWSKQTTRLYAYVLIGFSAFYLWQLFVSDELMVHLGGDFCAILIIVPSILVDTAQKNKYGLALDFYLLTTLGAALFLTAIRSAGLLAQAGY